MPYRNRTYVCFDADNDIHYYRLMCAWKQNDGFDFNFHNAHDLNNARDTSLEESIKRQLNERLNNSKLFIVLIGQQTRYHYKFVRWEMEQAITLRIPIIAVNLDGSRQQNPNTCPPIIREVRALYVSFNAKIIQYAMDSWPRELLRITNAGLDGPFYYKDEIYREVGAR